MKIKSILVAFFTLCVFFVGAKSFAKDLKFIQITDSHFSPVAIEGSQREVEKSKGILEKTMEDINTIPDVNFVVFTGDNIDQSNDTDLKAFLKIANKLHVPYYVVIGNHEVFKSQKFDKKEYMKVVRRYSKNCRPSGASYVFKRDGFVFIVVDGAKEVIPGPAGYFKKDTLKWLDKQLTKYKNENIVIFQHFPIVPPYYNRTHATYNVDEYKKVLKNHNNVIAIFSGHYHGNGEQMVEGVYHVSTPALVAAPHDYKVIEIKGNSKKGFNVYTQLRHAE